MGCRCSSPQDGSPQPKPKGVGTRRLSIDFDNVEKKPANGHDAKDDILDLLEKESNVTGYTQTTMSSEEGPKAGHRKFSISTMTDKDMHRRKSYADKTVEASGDSISASDVEIGYACKKGLKPVSPNQDSFFITEFDDIAIYGVFDGHGRIGHDVSQFIKENLPKFLIKHPGFRSNPEQALTDAFLQTQDTLEKMQKEGHPIDASSSGSTGTVAIHNKTDNVLWLAHVGDSRAVLGTVNQNGVYTMSPSQRARKESTKKTKSDLYAEELTQDHKPELEHEKQRIIAKGGQVHKPLFDINYRVYVANQPYPGLAMSRALGDLIGYRQAGISAEPEIKKRHLDVRYGANSKRMENSPDRFMLLCSDGVWEFINSQEAVDMCNKFAPSEAMDAAEFLAQESWDRWIRMEHGQVVDDITALVVWF